MRSTERFTISEGLYGTDVPELFVSNPLRVAEIKRHTKELLNSYQFQISEFSTMLSMSGIQQTLSEAADFFRGHIEKSYEVRSHLFDGSVQKDFESNDLYRTHHIVVHSCSLFLVWEEQEISIFRRKFEAYKYTPIRIQKDGRVSVSWDNDSVFFRWKRSQNQTLEFPRSRWEQDANDFSSELFGLLQKPLVGFVPLRR